jgi:hypothetical protein
MEKKNRYWVLILFIIGLVGLTLIDIEILPTVANCMAIVGFALGWFVLVWSFADGTL